MISAISKKAERKVKKLQSNRREKTCNSQDKTDSWKAEGISALSLHTGLVTLEKYRQLETALKGISLDVSDSLSGSWIPCAGKG